MPTKTMRTSLALGLLTIAVAAAAQSSVRELRLVTEMTIDGEAEEFTFTGFALALPTGKVAFGDVARYELRLYSPDGKLLGRAGRRGAGPGEFAYNGRMAALSGGLIGDSIWVYDAKARRVSIFSTTGRFSRSISVVPLSSGPTSFDPLAVYRNGTLLGLQREWTAGRDEDSRMLVLRRASGAELSRIELKSSSTSISVRDPKTGQTHTWPVSGSSNVRYCVSQDGQSVGILRQSIIGDSAEVGISKLRPSGDTVASGRFRIATGARSRADANRFLSAFRADLRAAGHSIQYVELVARAMEQAMPKVVFPASALNCGSDGSMWILVRTPAGSRDWAWIAIDPAMRVIGRTRPANLWMLQPSMTSAITAQVSRDGVPSVFRMRVVR